MIDPIGRRAGIAGATICLLAQLAGPAVAQDIEPRQYSNIPVGMSFLFTGLTRSEGGVLFDPSVPLENAEIGIDGLLAAYARGLALGRFSAKFDSAIGRICLNGSAEQDGVRRYRNVCGTSDTKLRLTVNLFGAPPLSASAFPQYRQKLIVGASIAVSLPTGQYDADRLVNIGTNRHAIKGEFGISRALAEWTLELALAGNWFDTNTNYFGGQRRSQEPIYSLQGHAVRHFNNGRWLAIGATRYTGGETTVDGRSPDNFQSNGRIGLTWSMPLTPRHALRLAYSRGVQTRTGTDFDTLAVAWQMRWGNSPPQDEAGS